MKIQFLNGGLANQAFQYIFARFCELYNPEEPVWLDDSFFFVKKEHNGYELEKVFGIKARLLSEYFSPDVWEYLIEKKRNGISICQSFRDMGEDIMMIAEADNYKNYNPFDGEIRMVKCNQFIPALAQVEGNTYYHGYWINKNWLYTYKEVLFKELTFPLITDERNLRYKERIENSESIAIHIRRGDYVKLGWQLSEDIYRSGCEEVVKRRPDAWFFVFSDDVAWCRENAEKLGLNLARQVTYIEGNMDGNNYVDMQLMAMCKGLIMSNSAFCYLAALLNTRKDIFCNPLSGMRDL